MVAVADPNRRVQGGGAQALARDAGVGVDVGCLEAEARALNRMFFVAMELARPHVTLKCAMTLDGKIAAFDRSARWITGEEARREAHRLRSLNDAVMVGIGTVLADDPLLTVRLDPPWPREPWRVVVDSRARLPLDARLIGAGTPGRVVVAVADGAPAARVAALESLGLTVLACKSRDDRVDPGDLLGRLLALDVSGVLLEGGSELNWAFLESGLVDRVAMFESRRCSSAARRRPLRWRGVACFLPRRFGSGPSPQGRWEPTGSSKATSRGRTRDRGRESTLERDRERSLKDMFTGLIEEVGSVVRREGARLVVEARVVLPDAVEGASIAVNGACLTVVERGPGWVGFDLGPETLARTTLGDLAVGHRVNLERPLRLGALVGGHLVQGRVDGVGIREGHGARGRDGPAPGRVPRRCAGRPTHPAGFGGRRRRESDDRRARRGDCSRSC